MQVEEKSNSRLEIEQVSQNSRWGHIKGKLSILSPKWE